MEMTNFDRHASAVAFAEAGEHDTARQMLSGDKGQSRKAQAPEAKKKPYAQTLICGALSLAAYYYLFTNERWVTTTFTMGGWYAAYPILTAFFFSFVHGAFGSNLLNVLGLEAKK
ncbi:MAG: hypothetical protein OEV91_05970 [Desulfobulbaceae bacterium]|nr:hypothetical protein [Desulfobulbaceae bacterium]